jgi:hypothetical protein
MDPKLPNSNNMEELSRILEYHNTLHLVLLSIIQHNPFRKWVSKILDKYHSILNQMECNQVIQGLQFIMLHLRDIQELQFTVLHLKVIQEPKTKWFTSIDKVFKSSKRAFQVRNAISKAARIQHSGVATTKF